MLDELLLIATLVELGDDSELWLITMLDELLVTPTLDVDELVDTPMLDVDELVDTPTLELELLENCTLELAEVADDVLLLDSDELLPLELELLLTEWLLLLLELTELYDCVLGDDSLGVDGLLALVTLWLLLDPLDTDEVENDPEDSSMSSTRSIAMPRGAATP